MRGLRGKLVASAVCANIAGYRLKIKKMRACSGHSPQKTKPARGESAFPRPPRDGGEVTKGNCRAGDAGGREQQELSQERDLLCEHFS